jgi:hypothetical protein
MIGLVVLERTLSMVSTIVSVTSAAQFGSVNGLPAMGAGYPVIVNLVSAGVVKGWI